MTTHMPSKKRSYSQSCIVFHRFGLLPFLEIVKGEWQKFSEIYFFSFCSQYFGNIFGLDVIFNCFQVVTVSLLLLGPN